jgi:FMNH2-dependent dimethyl sulfone monooxygenase
MREGEAMQNHLTHRERLDQRPFVIGLFFPTMSGGWIMSSAAWEKRREQWRWPYLSQLARRADALDLDYLFMGMAYPPYGGFGGRSIDFRAYRMESISTAAAVAAITERVFICPTVHILYHLHPIFLAQLATTIDHISNGRFGMNIVAGFSPYEQALLDVPALAHDERYQAADEFVAIMRRTWTESEPFDFDGRYYRSQRAWVSPKPIQRPYPLLVNAGLSEAGREFAARVCDWSFINPPNVRDVESARPLCADLKARAARHGRVLRLSTQGIIVCKETDDEAQAYYEWIIANAADDVVAAWQEQSRQAVARGLSQDTSRFASDRAKGEGRVFVSGVVIVGSPRTVAEQLIAIQRVGIDGLHLGFLDYDELDFFGARVLPLLREAGLR